MQDMLSKNRQQDHRTLFPETKKKILQLFIAGFQETLLQNNVIVLAIQFVNSF